MVSTSSALEPVASGNERAPTHAADDFSQFLKLAIEELSRGKLEVALVAASEACHRAPHEPRAHYVYGQAWLALNQPARAQQAFGTAIQLASGWADAWVNYGIARYRQGDIEDAKTAMRQALARAPGHAAAGAKTKWEFPRLCRGGSKSLTYPGVGSLGPSTRIASRQAHERESHRRMTMKA
jgi:Tfp pilus assembly protein PilF